MLPCKAASYPRLALAKQRMETEPMAADTKTLHDLMNHGGILGLFSGGILSLDSKGSPFQSSFRY